MRHIAASRLDYIYYVVGDLLLSIIPLSVSIIPHTAAQTILGSKKVGDVVNLENDIIGKYVEKLMKPADDTPKQSNITMDFLMKNGF